MTMTDIACNHQRLSTANQPNNTSPADHSRVIIVRWYPSTAEGKDPTHRSISFRS